jgi:hypothetical protein
MRVHTSLNVQVPGSSSGGGSSAASAAAGRGAAQLTGYYAEILHSMGHPGHRALMLRTLDVFRPGPPSPASSTALSDLLAASPGAAALACGGSRSTTSFSGRPAQRGAPRSLFAAPYSPDFARLRRSCSFDGAAVLAGSWCTVAPAAAGSASGRRSMGGAIDARIASLRSLGSLSSRGAAAALGALPPRSFGGARCAASAASEVVQRSEAARVASTCDTVNTAEAKELVPGADRLQHVARSQHGAAAPQPRRKHSSDGAGGRDTRGPGHLDCMPEGPVSTGNTATPSALPHAVTDGDHGSSNPLPLLNAGDEAYSCSSAGEHANASEALLPLHGML